MKATGTLPSEQRAKDMNDIQWLWYYMNIMKDEEEAHERMENYMDYMGSWVNPQLAKSVMEQKRKKNKQLRNNTNNLDINPDLNPELTYAETAVSSDFDDEFKKALAGENGEIEITELPSSDNVGDPNEDPEDFFARAMNFEHLVDTNPFKEEPKQNIVDMIDPIALNNVELEDLNKVIPNVLNIDDLDYFDEE